MRLERAVDEEVAGADPEAPDIARLGIAARDDQGHVAVGMAVARQVARVAQLTAEHGFMKPSAMGG